jgi:hypothetical protein
MNRHYALMLLVIHIFFVGQVFKFQPFLLSNDSLVSYKYRKFDAWDTYFLWYIVSAKGSLIFLGVLHRYM